MYETHLRLRSAARTIHCQNIRGAWAPKGIEKFYSAERRNPLRVALIYTPNGGIPFELVQFIRRTAESPSSCFDLYAERRNPLRVALIYTPNGGIPFFRRTAESPSSWFNLYAERRNPL